MITFDEFVEAMTPEAWLKLQQQDAQVKANQQQYDDRVKKSRMKPPPVPQKPVSDKPSQ